MLQPTRDLGTPRDGAARTRGGRGMHAPGLVR
eukprot:COSAG02_NODE_5453_length_4304_cov_2.319382_2_plen_32_part_00